MRDSFVQSANGDYRLNLGIVLQADGRFSMDDPPPVTNTFSIRKARVVLAGRAAKYFDYRFMPDFGSGSPTILDVHFDVRFSRALRIRAGKDKTPIGYELLIGDTSLLFPERSLASSLVPNRDVGFQAQGDLANGKVYFAGGVFNGVPDGTSSSADGHEQSQGRGRALCRAYRRARLSDWRLARHGGAPRAVVQDCRLARRGSPTTGPVPALGTHNRVTPSVLLSRPASVRSPSSFARRRARRTRAGVTTIANQAWDVTDRVRADRRADVRSRRAAGSPVRSRVRHIGARCSLSRATRN